jgi:hypothetical protein
VDEHRCGIGKLCRDPQINAATGHREPAIIEEQRGLCRRCRAALRRAIEELADDYCRLSEAAQDGLAATGSEHVSGTPTPAAPLNMAAVGLRSTLSEWAEAAVRMVAETLNVAPRARQKAKGYPVYEYPPISQAMNILPEHLDTLIESSPRRLAIWRDGQRTPEDVAGIDVCIALMQNHWRTTSLLGETNPRRRLAMPCPVLDCGAQTLGIANGETDVTCSTCGSRWSEREYEWLAGLLIDEDKRAKRKAKMALPLDIAKWLVAQRDWQLKEVRRIASLTAEQLEGIDGWAVVQLLRETFGGPE